MRPVEHGGGRRRDKLMTILMMLGISTHLARGSPISCRTMPPISLSFMLLALRRCGLRGKLKSGHGVVSVGRPFDGEVNAPQVWPNKIPLARCLQQYLMDPPC